MAPVDKKGGRKPLMERENMENQLTGEQYLSFLAGQIHALTIMCGSLVAMAQNRAVITDLFKKLSGHSVPVQDTFSKYYISGIKRVIEELEALLAIAAAAEQRALQKPGKDN